MERSYLSPIFKDDPGEFGIPGAWHHRLQTDHDAVPYEGGEIRTDPDTGLPTEQSVLVVVEAEDHTPFLENPNLTPIPIGALDAKVEAPIAKLEAIGYSRQEIDAVWNGDLRSVLNYYGRLNNPDFNCDDYRLGG
jgi:hypothetical protein